ncbi:MAG: two-component system LytT family response regulator [Saprospiraceae bacterium]|jgi:two-component system LytT family response regulator
MSDRIKAIIVDDEPIAREILEQHFKNIPIITIVASCKNATEAFQVISKEEVDLIFLDINMPDISGLSLAKSLNSKSKIIFTTAYREYAVDGFDLQAVDYLLKPISLQRLQQGIHKYMNESEVIDTPRKPAFTLTPKSFMFVKSDRKLIKINYSEILYIESLSDYIKIHLNDKTVVTRETISKIASALPPELFIRCHRSFIVAIGKIEAITAEEISIQQTSIPISRSYKEIIQNRFGLL